MQYSQTFIRGFEKRGLSIDILPDYSKIYDYKSDYDSLKEIREKFNGEKLFGILNYTDEVDKDGDPINPQFYSAVVSKCIYNPEMGAKGISKSFGSMICTVFFTLHDINFNSIWTRNQYNHIATTLQPLVDKVLSFLKEKHEIDLTPYFTITSKVAGFNRNLGRISQGIYFGNWENLQSFQGINVKHIDHYFGEFVIDEPIEDLETTILTIKELEKIYETQKRQMPIILSNTIFRVSVPQHVNLKCKLLFNLFDENHGTAQDYLFKVIQLNPDMVDLMIENKFIQAENQDEKQGLGIVATCYSKYFVPRHTMQETQGKQLEQLKIDNYASGVVTVAGLSFKEEDASIHYFLKRHIFNPDGTLIDRTYKKDIEKEIKIGNIVRITDGFDLGKRDKSSWCRLALDKGGNYILITIVKDVFLDPKVKKQHIKNNTFYATVPSQVINFMKLGDEELKLSPTPQFQSEFAKNHIPLVATDRDYMANGINKEMQITNYNALCVLANRKDTKNQTFGIKSRQDWGYRILATNKFFVLTGNEGILPEIAKQVILEGEDQRNEKIHPEIYDGVNAIEYAGSLTYLGQSALATNPEGEN